MNEPAVVLSADKHWELWLARRHHGAAHGCEAQVCQVHCHPDRQRLQPAVGMFAALGPVNQYGHVLAGVDAETVHHLGLRTASGRDVDVSGMSMAFEKGWCNRSQAQ